MAPIGAESASRSFSFPPARTVHEFHSRPQDILVVEEQTTRRALARSALAGGQLRMRTRDNKTDSTSTTHKHPFLQELSLACPVIRVPSGRRPAQGRQRPALRATACCAAMNPGRLAAKCSPSRYLPKRTSSSVRCVGQAPKPPRQQQRVGPAPPHPSACQRGSPHDPPPPPSLALLQFTLNMSQKAITDTVGALVRPLLRCPPARFGVLS